MKEKSPNSPRRILELANMLPLIPEKKKEQYKDYLIGSNREINIVNGEFRQKGKHINPYTIVRDSVVSFVIDNQKQLYFFKQTFEQTHACFTKGEVALLAGHLKLKQTNDGTYKISAFDFSSEDFEIDLPNILDCLSYFKAHDLLMPTFSITGYSTFLKSPIEEENLDYEEHLNQFESMIPSPEDCTKKATRYLAIQSRMKLKTARGELFLSTLKHVESMPIFPSYRTGSPMMTPPAPSSLSHSMSTLNLNTQNGTPPTSPESPKI